MALNTISNTATIYQDTSNPVQKANMKSSSQQNMSEGNTVGIGIAEASAAAKLLTEQNNMSESNKQKKENEANAQHLKSAVTQANSKMKHVRTGCEFSYHEETNRVSIKVFDKDTHEVIREIPPEESLEVLEKVWEIAGLLVDERR